MAVSYDDPVKQKSREKLRDFIKKNLHKRPSDIRVVCFPGAEVEGEEAIEVKEIYDPLGIPRENVVGLEYDAERAERLRKANLGIQVVHAPALGFFGSTEGVFDVISLDYSGHQDEKELQTLEEIAGRQVLCASGVLTTNYAAKRETRALQARKFHRFTRGIASGDFKHPRLKGDPDRQGLLKEFIEGESDITLADARDSSTSEVMRVFSCGIFNKKNVIDFFRAHPEYEENNLRIWEIVKSGCQQPSAIEQTNYMIAQGVLPPDWIEQVTSRPPDNRLRNYRVRHAEAMTAFVADNLGVPEEVADDLVTFLYHLEAKSYFVEQIERYGYNSNKNMLMHIDMFKFEQHRKVFSRGEKIVDVFYDTDPPTIMFDRLGLRDTNPRRFYKELFRWAKSFMRLIYPESLDEPKIPERVYLGSSFKLKKKPEEPEPEKEAISKEDAVMLLRSGCSPKEIRECYSGFTEHQLRAYKAHYVTMGKELKPTGS